MARLSTWFGVGLGAALLLPAAFSQIVPGRADQAARVVSLDGQVSVMRDAIPWALKEGDPVRVRELIVTGPDGSAVFELADGSTFEIYPNSHVTFRNTPGNLRDLLDLWLGRIKVHIRSVGGRRGQDYLRHGGRRASGGAARASSERRAENPECR